MLGFNNHLWQVTVAMSREVSEAFWIWFSTTERPWETVLIMIKFALASWSQLEECNYFILPPFFCVNSNFGGWVSEWMNPILHSIFRRLWRHFSINHYVNISMEIFYKGDCDSLSKGELVGNDWKTVFFLQIFYHHHITKCYEPAAYTRQRVLYVLESPGLSQTLLYN